MCTINFDRLQADTTAKAFLNQLPGFCFKEVSPDVYRYPNRDSGLKLFRTADGSWAIKNHSGKYDVPDGNIYTFTQRLNNLDNGLHIARLIAEAEGLNFDNYITGTYDDQTVLSIPHRTPQAFKIEPEYKISSEIENHVPDNRELFTQINTYAKGHDAAGVIKHWTLKGLEGLLNKTDNRSKFEAPAILKGVFVGGVKGIHCKQSAVYLPFDIDVKKNENAQLLDSDNNAKVFKALQGLSVLSWRSNSGKGMAGYIFVPQLEFFTNKDRYKHRNIAEEIYNYLAELIADKTGLTVTFDNAQGKFRQIRFLAKQTKKRSINPRPFKFTFEEVVPESSGGCHIDKTVNFKQYITERQSDIKHQIDTNARLIIEAPTGSGKTWLAMDFMNDHLEGIRFSGCDYIIFAVPRLPIAKQFKNDFRERYGYHIDIVSENFKGITPDAKVFISTFDSVAKLKKLLPESLLIVDESHLMFDDAGFRNNPCNEIFSWLEHTQKSLLISATPYYLPGWNILKGICENPQKAIIQPVFYKDGTVADLPIPEGDGLHIVRINDTDTLEALQKYIGESATIISKKYGAKYTDENPNYKHLMRTGTLPEGIKYLLTTSLLDVGVSIRQQVASVTMFSPKQTNEVLQHIARARKDGIINSNVKVNVYLKHGTGWNEGGFYVDFEGIVNELRQRYRGAAEGFNMAVPFFKESGSKYDELINLKQAGNFIWFNRSTDQYEVSEPTIYNEALKVWKSKISWKGFFSEIARRNENITIAEPLDVSFRKNKDVQDAAKISRDEKKALQAEAFEVFHNSPRLSLVAIANNTGNLKLRDKIHKIFKTKKIGGDAILNDMPRDHFDILDINVFYENHRKLFDYGFMDRPAKRFCEMLNLGIEVAEVLQHVHRNQTPQSYNKVFNIAAILYKPEVLNVKMHRMKGEKLDAILQAHRISSGAFFSITQLKSMLKAAGFEREQFDNDNKIKLRFSELYQVDITRKKKRRETRYLVGEKWTKKTLAELSGFSGSKNAKKSHLSRGKVDVFF